MDYQTLYILKYIFRLTESFFQFIVIENDKHRYDRRNFYQDRCTCVSEVMSLYDASFLRNYIRVVPRITTSYLSATIYIAHSQREIKRRETRGREGGGEKKISELCKRYHRSWFTPGLHRTITQSPLIFGGRSHVGFVPRP